MKLLTKLFGRYNGITPTTQEHEVLLTMLEFYPNRVPCWELISRTKSTCYGKVVSMLRSKLKEIYEQEFEMAHYGDPLISENEQALNQYGNRTNHGFYRLNPRYHQAAIILEHKLRK